MVINRAVSSCRLFLGLCDQSGFFFLFLLQGILFALTFSAAKALGGQTLVSKGGPRSEVFAPLAPLDLETAVRDDPYVDVAQCAQALVLSWDDGVAAVLVAQMILSVVVSRCKPTVVLATRFAVALLTVLVSGRTRTRLPTHDATPHTFGKVDGLLL